MRKWEESKR